MLKDARTNEELVLAYRNGDMQAGEALLVKNRPLIRKTARKMFINEVGFEMGNARPGYDDLIQLCSVALLKIAKKYFRPELGFKFSTYAFSQLYRIASYEARSSSQQSTYFLEKLRVVKSTKEQIFYETGKRPSQKEVAERLGRDGWRIMALTQQKKSFFRSLDDSLGEEKGSERFVDLLPDPNVANPVLTVRVAFLKQLVRGELNNLSKQEKTVLLGLYQDNENMAQVGKRLGLTRERIRQIKESALQKMRLALLDYDLSLD